MRSLRYILGGCPHKLDDCLDFARNHRPMTVTLDLATDEFAIDMCATREFVGIYQWQFENLAVCCREVYGVVRLPARQQDEESAVAAANARLQRWLKKIAGLGVQVLGVEKRFREIGSQR